MVGKTGFEPAALWSQTRCATKLRHFPKKVCLAVLVHFVKGNWGACRGGAFVASGAREQKVFRGAVRKMVSFPAQLKNWCGVCKWSMA